MRTYSIVAPSFWTGETGIELQKRGQETVIMGFYLLTSPHSNMLGLYRQPVGYAGEENGLGLEGATKGLQGCIEAGFCKYDWRSKFVWVIEMAAWQIAKQIKESDNRSKGIQVAYNALPDNLFLADWFDHYQAAFHLKEKRFPKGAYQAPPKPGQGRAGQEQDRNRTGQVSTSPGGDVGDNSGAEDADLLGDATGGQVAAKPRNAVPFQKIIELYHAILPELPRVEKLTEKRRGQIRQRWQDDLTELEHWENFFAFVRRSDFLMGRKPGTNGRPPFRADIEWLTNATNFTAISEEKYHR